MGWRRLLGLAILCCVSFNASAAEPAKPVEVKPSIVAIVDIQRILQASKAAKSVQQQLDAQRSKFQTEIATEETGLREAEQKLAKLRETAKTDEYVEQEQKLQQRFMSVERHVQARRKALDQGNTDAMNVVRKGLVDIVSQIAKERGVNLVIVKQQVIWNDQTIDITDDVLVRLDKALPQVPVNVVTEEVKPEQERPLLIKPKPAKTGKKKD